MKKLFFIVAIAIFGFTANAQKTKFGASAGYTSLIASASAEGVSASASSSGFHVGIFADITTSDKFHVQPELQYVNISQDGASGNLLVLPIMGKYYVSNEFSIQAGPQFDLILDESEGVKTFGFGLGAGVGYDISEHFIASIRYSFGLNNRIEDEPSEDFEDVKVKFNFFQIGVGYRF